MKTGITSISIENFKGFGEKVTIPLKPITLLFGKNSAGKSTVLQAFALVRSVLENGTDNYLPVECSGYKFPFEDFESFVHQHNRDQVVGFEINYTISKAEKSTFKTPYVEKKLLPKQITLRIELRDGGNQRVSSEYELYYEGHRFCSGNYYIGQGWMLSAYPKESKPHPIFLSAMREIGIDNDFQPPPDGFHKHGDSYFDFLLWPDMASEKDKDGNRLDESWDLCEDGIDELCCGDWEKTEDLKNFLNQYVIKPFKIIHESLSELRFLGPLREIPKTLNNLENIKSSDWYAGQSAWLWCGKLDDLKDLHRENYSKMESAWENSSVLRNYISALDWFPYEFTRTGILNLQIPSNIYLETDYFHAEKERSLEEKSDLIKGYIEKEYGNNWPIKLIKENFSLIKKCRKVEVEPRAVGTGISQVFPIIASTILPDSNLCAYEQPELHLHPAMQCDLADVFIYGTKLHLDRVSILETHSEHIILRLLRRMRETAADKVPEGKELTPDDVAVLAFEPGENGTEVYEMEISKSGELLTPWPNGFFPERMNEILGE